MEESTEKWAVMYLPQNGEELDIRNPHYEDFGIVIIAGPYDNVKDAEKALKFDNAKGHKRQGYDKGLMTYDPVTGRNVSF